MGLFIIGGGGRVTSKGPYELWKESGHPTGTVQEYLDSLKGAPGDDSVFVQPNQPVNPKLPCIWIQTGIGPGGKGITINIMTEK